MEAPNISDEHRLNQKEDDDDEEECSALLLGPLDDGDGDDDCPSDHTIKRNPSMKDFYRFRFIVHLLIGLNAVQLLFIVYRSFHDARKTVSYSDEGSFLEHYPMVMGHVHMAKTAGSEINGQLASHFERVCGNKGYSYDFFEYNELNRQKLNGTDPQQIKPGGRGKVSVSNMNAIGYQDCDFVSIEGKTSRWEDVVSKVGPMELHIPCREPVSHLLSQCNHRNKEFHCETDDLEAEVDRCIIGETRFSSAVFESNANFTLKCFNPIPTDGYLNLMSNRLQRKRMESDYVHRDTNKPRDKSKECLRKDVELAEKVRKIMVDQYDYYRFCDKCLGSENDLLA